MARIRSIKPEFFTSDQIAECSPNARLAFIGLWCFADDAGIHPASNARLKMEVFPADSFDKDAIGMMVQELNDAGLIESYTVNGESFWRITGWSKHQKIDQPTFKYPHPDGSIPSKVRRTSAEDSANPSRTFSAGEERRGEESNGERTSSSEEVSAGGSSPADQCPHADIIAAYHEILPELARVRSWDADRQRMLRSRWREDSQRQSVAWWREFFSYVKRCPFLIGQQCSEGREPFLADLEWLIRPKNFRKVIEGKYESRKVA